jgi:glycosyltransferase involved in cell wall biosynthesis
MRVPDSKLVVIGSGWDDVDAPRAVRFAGWTDSLVDQYEDARLVIAPLFSGGGTKLKVLEGMAAGRPVVTTPIGAEGLPAAAGLRVSIDPETFADAVSTYLTDVGATRRDGARNREAVGDLRWSSIWSRAFHDLRSMVRRVEVEA